MRTTTVNTKDKGTGDLSHSPRFNPRPRAGGDNIRINHYAHGVHPRFRAALLSPGSQHSVFRPNLSASPAKASYYPAWVAKNIVIPARLIPNTSATCSNLSVSGSSSMLKSTPFYPPPIFKYKKSTLVGSSALTSDLLVFYTLQNAFSQRPVLLINRYNDCL